MALARGRGVYFTETDLALLTEAIAKLEANFEEQRATLSEDAAAHIRYHLDVLVGVARMMARALKVSEGEGSPAAAPN